MREWLSSSIWSQSPLAGLSGAPELPFSLPPFTGGCPPGTHSLPPEMHEPEPGVCAFHPNVEEKTLCWDLSDRPPGLLAEPGLWRAEAHTG